MSAAEIILDSDPFPSIGEAFERIDTVRLGKVGIGEARLFRQRPTVDFAMHWLRRNRNSEGTLATQ